MEAGKATVLIPDEILVRILCWSVNLNTSADSGEGEVLKRTLRVYVCTKNSTTMRLKQLP